MNPLLSKRKTPCTTLSICLRQSTLKNTAMKVVRSAYPFIFALAAVLFIPTAHAGAEAAPAPESGRGWVEPTPHDHKLLQALGSRIKQIHLNLRGLSRLVKNYHDRAPGAAAPPNGKLVRAPGLGLQASRLSDASDTDNLAEDHIHFPRAVDNSELPCFPPIFDQGALNSCTSVAVTYYQLTHMTGLARGWDQKRNGGALRFSPMWTFNLINSGNNQGAFQVRAYAALLSHGAVTLKDMPYLASTTPALNYRRWPDNPKLWEDALAYRPESFGLIEEPNIVNLLRKIKLLIVNGHVLTAATGIDGWNAATIEDNPRSHLDTKHVGEYIATRVSPVTGNHCITIVGYNDDLWVDLNGNGEVDPDEKGALKIANSWGLRDWNRGFRWLHYSALYAPRTPGEAEERQAALYRNQVFWVKPSRDYKPALVMQVDLPPLYRNEFSLSAGVGAPNLPYQQSLAENFAFNFNGGRYGFTGRNTPADVHAVLDLTRPAMQRLAQQPAFFVRLDRQHDTPPILPQVRLLETASGTVHELTLTPTAQPNTYTAHAPDLARLTVPEFHVTVPPQLDISPGQTVVVPIEIAGATAPGQAVDVKVFSCNAAILASDDLSIARDATGRTLLHIQPRPNTSGSCVLNLHASSGDRDVNTSIRVNLLQGNETPPDLVVGTTQRKDLQVEIPFQIHPAGGAADDVVVFFDASNLDQIAAYDFKGTGTHRVLSLQLRFWAPFELSLSALDGSLVGSRHVKVDS